MNWLFVANKARKLHGLIVFMHGAAVDEHFVCDYREQVWEKAWLLSAAIFLRLSTVWNYFDGS